MNPLLIAINAKYIHTNNAIRLLKANSQYTIDIKDFTIKDPLDDMITYIQSHQPLFVGFSTYIWNVEIIQTLSQSLKGIPIVLGGPEVSYDPDAFLDFADVIVLGEGEQVFDYVIEHYKNGSPLKGLNNIAIKGYRGKIEEIKDLSTLKMPYYFEADQPHYPNKIAYIESSRGCPYKCSYCLSSLEKKVRFFPVDTVKDSIQYLLNQGAKTFKFLDRTFNANKQMFDLIDYIIEHHLEGTVFQFEITGDTLDPKIVHYIHEKAPKNLFRFEIGIQSTHKETNLLVDRIQNTEKLFQIITLIESEKIIDLHLDLIAGLPKEDLNRFKQTFDEVYNLGSKELQLGFLKMLRGTKLRYQAELYGYSYHKNAPYEIIKNDILSKADIKIIKEVEVMLNIIHNKGFFGQYAFDIITQTFPSSFDFFKALYDYFKAQKIETLHYQIDAIFKGFSDFLITQNIPEVVIDQIKIIYLSRSKVRPKVYFDIIKDKRIKHTVFEQLKDKLPLQHLFKYALVTTRKGGYIVATYKDFQSTIYLV